MSKLNTCEVKIIDVWPAKHAHHVPPHAELDRTLYAGHRGPRFGTSQTPGNVVWYTLKRYPFEWDTWILLYAPNITRYNYYFYYAYRGYLWPWTIAHARCENCTLAYMSHVDGRCMFDVTMFKWRCNVTKRHRQILNIVTGKVFQL